jgi:hypothetical protein
MTKEKLDAIRERLDAASVVRALMYVSMEASDLRALLDEVERLTADPLPAAAWVREVGRAAFARGAEAMRTALLQRVSWGSDLADRIRAEPVPEER